MHKTRRKHKHKIEHETSNKLDLIELRLFKEAMKLERKRRLITYAKNETEKTRAQKLEKCFLGWAVFI